MSSSFGGDFASRTDDRRTTEGRGRGTGGGRGRRVDRNKEMRVWKTREEREEIEVMGNLYGIIKATDRLEQLWTRGVLDAEDYTSVCRDLIGNYELTMRQLSAAGTITSARDFCAQHRIRCVAGLMRLESGVPATADTVHGGAQDTRLFSLLMDTGVSFVSALDAIEMNHRSKEELWTPIQEISTHLHGIPTLPVDFTASIKLKAWLETMAAMSVADELDDDQIRQLRFDLQTSYDSLKSHFNLGGPAPKSSRAD